MQLCEIYFSFFSLKERPISPGPGPPAPHAPNLPLPSMSSPLPSLNSPLSAAAAQAQTIFKPAQPTAQVGVGLLLDSLLYPPTDQWQCWD